MENVSKQNEKMRKFLDELKELLDKYNLSLISFSPDVKFDCFGNFLGEYWEILVKGKME